MATDIEKALDNGTAPWKEIDYRTKTFWVFRDPTIIIENYLCFVPAQRTMECLFEAYKAAYKWGYDGIESEKWPGFNIIQSVGIDSLYPHIHMIPRYPGDIFERELSDKI